MRKRGAAASPSTTCCWRRAGSREADYAAAVAGWLGVPLVAWEGALDLGDVGPAPESAAGLPARIDGRPCHVLAATGGAPDALMLQIVALRARGLHVVLAPGSVIDAALESHGRQQRIDHAVRGLLRERPVSSARSRTSAWQPAAAALLVGLAIGGALVLPDATLAAFTTLMALPFLCVTLLRLVALREAMGGANRARKSDPGPERLPDRQLPTYTVLVPLFREAKVLPGLIQSLRELDYPPAKLEIMLVVEAVDLEIQARCRRSICPAASARWWCPTRSRAPSPRP